MAVLERKAFQTGENTTVEERGKYHFLIFPTMVETAELLFGAWEKEGAFASQGDGGGQVCSIHKDTFF